MASDRSERGRKLRPQRPDQPTRYQQQQPGLHDRLRVETVRQSQRQLRQIEWPRTDRSAAASFGHSGLTNLPGTNSSSQGYTTGFGWKQYVNLSANYAKSNGLGLITGAGIQPLNLSPLLPSDLITLYGGTSYGAGLASTPLRKLTVSATYSKSLTNTVNAGIGSSNEFRGMNALLQYQFRKMYLTGGYANLSQGFSASGLPPAKISSFFLGVTRWFNFF